MDRSPDRFKPTTWPWPYLAALLALVVGGIALDAILQARPAALLDVGGRDLGYVEGFSSKEWSDFLPGHHGPMTATYRWMGARGTLRLGPVHTGPLPLRLRLRLLSGRPADAPWPQTELRVGGQPRAAFPVAPVLSEYALTLPTEDLQGGYVTIELATETFQPPEDPRDLGLIVERAWLEELGQGGAAGRPFALHRLRPVYALIGVATALGALALGLPFWPAWGLGAGLLALAGAAAAWRPEGPLHAGPTLLVLVLLGAVSAGVLRLLGPRWRRWARWLGDHAEGVLLVLFLLGLLLAFAPHIEADGVEYYAYLRSLAFDGDLHFANELSLDVPFEHVPYGLGAKKTPTGYEPNFASVGPAIVWAPLLPIGHLLALAGRALGMGWTVDGYSEPYVVLICFGSALSALATLLLGYDLVRRLYGRPLGLLATVATFWGTGLVYHAFYKPDFAHALAACGVTVFVSLWFRWRGTRPAEQWSRANLPPKRAEVGRLVGARHASPPPRGLPLKQSDMALRAATRHGNSLVGAMHASPPPRGLLPKQWFWLGLAAGFMSTLYWIDAILIVLPAAEALWEGAAMVQEQRWRDLRKLLLGGVLFALAFLLAFSPQMVAWKILFGQWFTVPQEGFATPKGFAALELLLSPLHGLVPWTPLAALGLLGLLLLAWKKRPWGGFLLLAMAAYFGYNATLGSWHGGGTFGLRRLVNAYPFFLLGVAALLEWVRRWRPAAALLSAFLPTLWGLVVLLRYLAYTIPHYPSELENLALGEFLFAPNNFPLDRLPDVLELSFFIQWGQRLARTFRPADLAYGVILLGVFIGLSIGVRRVLKPPSEHSPSEHPQVRERSATSRPSS